MDSAFKLGNLSMPGAARLGDIGLYEWNPLTEALSWDGTLARIFEAHPGEQPFQTWRRRVHLEDQERVLATFAEFRQAEDLFRLVMDDGSLRWVLSRATQVVRDENDAPIKVLGVLIDVTTSMEANARIATLLEAMQDGFLGLDFEYRITYVNARAEELLGDQRSRLLGRVLWDVFPDGLGTRFETAYARVLTDRVAESFEEYYPAPLNMWIEVNAQPTPEGAAVYFRDVTERRRQGEERERLLEAEQHARAEAERARELLWHQAHHDSLTGLLNRARLTERLAEAVAAAERDQTSLAVLFIDIDNFKDINDGSGHLLGDQVLVETATRIEKTLRDGDTVARFGGDEFVVLLPNTDVAAASLIAHRLLAATREPMEVHGRRLHVSASVGLAVSPPVEPRLLLQSADAALYYAKSQGRGQARAFVGELSERAEERVHLSSDLADALAHDQLHLVYQPIIDLASGRVLGVEALARWQHPSRGVVPPDVFVAIAEETGLAARLDTWVLRRACTEMAELRRAGAVSHDAYVAVNVTASSLGDDGFPDTVLHALATAHLPPAALVIEVTETGVMKDVDTGVSTLEALRAAGVRSAIDDFGTGWSSLSYLKRLPASILKLDRSFVARLHEDQGDHAIAAAVIGLAQATGMTVVAEGVETAEQLAALRELRCTSGQGYLWHHGVLPAQVAQAVQRAQAVGHPAAPARERGLRVALSPSSCPC